MLLVCRANLHHALVYSLSYGLLCRLVDSLSKQNNVIWVAKIVHSIERFFFDTLRLTPEIKMHLPSFKVFICFVCPTFIHIFSPNQNGQRGLSFAPLAQELNEEENMGLCLCALLLLFSRRKTVWTLVFMYRRFGILSEIVIGWRWGWGHTVWEEKSLETFSSVPHSSVQMIDSIGYKSMHYLWLIFHVGDN